MYRFMSGIFRDGDVMPQGGQAIMDAFDHLDTRRPMRMAGRMHETAMNAPKQGLALS